MKGDEMHKLFLKCAFKKALETRVRIDYSIL